MKKKKNHLKLVFKVFARAKARAYLIYVCKVIAGRGRGNKLKVRILKYNSSIFKRI